MRRRPPLRLAILIVALAATTTIGVWSYHSRLPKRFAPVVEGHLYRSGLVTPEQLERVQKLYGIRRVVCLLNANAPQTVAERDAARRLGIEWYNVPLTGDGASTPQDREQILKLLSEPDAPPTLVHCAAGVNRTGLAIGLYRIRCQGWPLDRVLAELKQFDFEDEPQHENLRQALEEAAAQESIRARQAPASPSGERTARPLQRSRNDDCAS